MENTTIPYDVYESDAEIVIIMPLGGTKPESIEVKLSENTLNVNGERIRPELKENLVEQKQDCYRWKFQAQIQLPLTVYFDKIKINLTKENILMAIVPKYTMPQEIKLKVEMI